MKSIYNKRIVIIFLVLFCIAFVLIQFSPFGLYGLHQITGGSSILDLSFPWYSADDAYEVFTALGPEGRVFNLTKILPLDVFFPLSYGFFFCSLIGFLYKTVGCKKKIYTGLSFLGGFAAFFDLLENICIFIMLKSYPSISVNTARCSNIFTQTKFLFFGSAVLSVIAGVIIYRRRRRSKS